MTREAGHELTAAGRAFLAFWQSHYPDSFPVAHSLKWQFPKRWVRFHSLPDGQRYARTKGEVEVILMRQNTLINALIPQGTSIKILLSKLEPECHLFASQSLTHLGAFPDEAAEMPLQAWLMEKVWEAGSLDVILTQIADDQARAIFLGPDCLVAPYDGGVDLIVKDALTAHALKQQFHAWVSAREDGL